MATDIIKIIVVDDNKIFLESIVFYLSQQSKYTVINTASNGQEFLELPNIHKADIVFMDIEMPEINGVNATKKALINYNSLKIIALTNYEEKAYLITLIGAGFKGCVFKKNTFKQIENAIQKVLDGGLFFPERILNTDI